jgi:prepilin-type N-terminal cleavage/methylation domain-containing protein/prepilin-type processing-associated H-X9-DG protein
MKGKSAFTLVELLVVLSIIALLIALLVPALNRARMVAVGVTCMSNLRQVGLVAQTYASDHNQLWVIFGTNHFNNRWAKDRSWAYYAQYGGYLDYDWRYDDQEKQRNPWFTCPSSRFEATSFHTIRRNTYGTNYQAYYRGVSGLSQSDTDPTDWAPGAWNNGQDFTNGRYLRRVVPDRPPSQGNFPTVEIYLNFSGLKQPAEYFTVADTLMSGGLPHNQSTMAKGDPANDNVSTFWGIHAADASKANILFADGHVDAAGNDEVATSYYNLSTVGR